MRELAGRADPAELPRPPRRAPRRRRAGRRDQGVVEGARHHEGRARRADGLRRVLRRWTAVSAGAKWAFGRFLDYYGLRDIKDFILPRSDTERLLEMVQQINIRLNNLEASSDRLLKAIAELSTSVLAGRATELLTHINTNQNTLVSLTKLDPSKPGLMGGTRGLLDSDRPRRAEPQPAPRRPGGQRRRARAARRGLAARRRRAVLHDRRLEVRPASSTSTTCSSSCGSRTS